MTERRRRLLIRGAVVLVALVGGLCLAARVALAEIRYRWYLRDLATFGDPNVADLRRGSAREAYRLFWRSAWGNSAVITISVHESDRAVLRVKVPDSNAPLEKWKDTTVELDPIQVEGLRNVVDRNPFWREKPQYHFTVDGAAWFLEVKRGRKYYFSY